MKSMQKHLPLQYKEIFDSARIKEAVQREANASLRESFDFLMYEQPTWKKIEKEKWKTPRGISYSGQPSAHVSNAKTKLFGSSKLVEFSITGNNQLANRKTHYSQSAWKVPKNEPESGMNPYLGGLEEFSS